MVGSSELVLSIRVAKPFVNRDGCSVVDGKTGWVNKPALCMWLLGRGSYVGGLRA